MGSVGKPEHKYFFLGLVIIYKLLYQIIAHLVISVCSVAGKVCHPVVDVKDRCWQAATDSPGTGNDISII